MIKILNGKQLSDKLSKKIQEGESVRLAVAFWGSGATRSLNLDGHPDAKVICNLMSGGTNPHEIRELIKAGADVRMHNTLHAKIGVIGDTFSFVGSSNMSSNGLGFEGQEVAGWEEANVLFDGANSDVLERFNEYWKNAKSIKEKDIEAAENLWQPRRTYNYDTIKRSQDELESIWQAIQNNSNKLRSLACYIAYYREMTEPERTVYNVAEQQIVKIIGPKFLIYQDWKHMPKGYIIGACRSRQKKHILKHFDYSRHLTGAPEFTIEGDNYLAVNELSTIPGFQKFKGKDLIEMKKLILDFVGTKKKPKKSRIIPIQDLMDFYQNR